MRDLVAALVAAAPARSPPRASRRRCRCTGGGGSGRATRSARWAGPIIAEIPDRRRPGARSARTRSASTTASARSTRISIVAVRVLINGAPIAAYVSRRVRPRQRARQPTSFEDRPEGIARDRWDVAIETVSGTVLVECGAIRERVSQELARTVFDAVRRDLERRMTQDRRIADGYHSVSGTPARWFTARAMHEQQIGQPIDVAHAAPDRPAVRARPCGARRGGRPCARRAARRRPACRRRG